MKKLDYDGSKLCTYQAEIFSQSLTLSCSSLVFLRRFFNSHFARKLDDCEQYQLSYEAEDCFASILEQFGETEYGKKKLPENILYWLGYITRYFCYTRECSSKLLYKSIPLRFFTDNYEVYHTQNEEWVIARVLENTGKTEDDFDQDKRFKAILRKIWIPKLEAIDEEYKKLQNSQ